ncbi:hypothetical protein [Pseudomonas indica]|uniref:Uncharacterized protein n=1 Tax=Pseudomonas indica TaxID=137658 RepID=A0A1G8V646_9PSED|nr:hypothetical protein [Pseudomonas indica]SDJ61521.1 hypothetical protein SAMN05216186_102111 [Pseudomonas indica]
MALGDERRANGAANEAARRALGRTNETARRALGPAMEANRTGRKTVEDINSIVDPPRPRKSLPTLTPRGGVDVQRGRGVYQAPSGGTAGIASPLTEGATGPGAVIAREYYATSTLTSSDGILTLDVQALKKLTMRDANGSPVVIEFAEPPAE